VRKLCPELWRQKDWLLHHYKASSHALFSPVNIWPTTKWLSSPTHFIFSVYSIENKTERPSFWLSWADRERIAVCTEHPHRTRLPGCI
jgi:hypothetical protein